MNLKYFIRGLGAGIVFGTLIMLVAYMTNGGYKISDEEVINRAKKLGMVAAEELNDKETSEATTVTEITTEIAKISIEEVTTEATSEEVSETEATTIEETEATTEEVTTEAPTEAPTEAATEASTESQPGTVVKATITVTRGMGSQNVARLLQDAGIVESATDFDSYLIKNGYANRIEVGTYEFTNNMSYQQIADELVKKR